MPELHIAPLSPFARFALYFALASNIQVDVRPVDLMKGEHKTPAFLAINPHGQVPALVDGDVKLYESAAIVRYLARKYNDSLLPNDVTAGAAVDQVFEHLRSKIGGPVGSLVFNKVFFKFFGQQSNPEAITKAEADLAAAFGSLSANFFKTSPNHVIGSTTTLADIYLGTFLSQLTITRFDFTPYPTINNYFNNIKETDAFKRSHEQFYTILAHFAQQPQQ
eukprot:TRINITY_DN624_c0_g1_i1.p1 TRINITY_DN624_c0_g1~~TRINITY_DN624_c0_g1_i1.p1  ORF type:complete len:221 (-),score=122.90 TRINITY_DN624_c0_g1_i1:78-740(-)